jgi:hypothetical protein
MSIDTDRGFLGVGGTAAGAGIAVSLANVALPLVSVSAFVPMVGGLLALMAMKFSGVLDDPAHPLVTDEVDAT